MIPDISIEVDIGEDEEQTSSSNIGPGAQPTQPPHPQLEVDTLTSDISVSALPPLAVDPKIGFLQMSSRNKLQLSFMRVFHKLRHFIITTVKAVLSLVLHRKHGRRWAQ